MSVDEKLREQGILTGADTVPADSIRTGDILDATITSADLASLAVTTAKIDNLAVTAGKIAALAVETAKINDLAVTTGKIANGAVTADKLSVAPGAIATAMIADDAVDNTKLANMAIGTVKCGGALDAPTDVSLAALAAGALIVGQGVGAAPLARVIGTDASIDGTGALTITADAVTNVKAANIPIGCMKIGGAANAPTDYDVSTVGLGAIPMGQGAGVAVVAHILSGDIVNDETGACIIQALAVETGMLNNDSVTNDKLANITAGSVKCGGVANAPTDVDCSAAGAVVFGQGVGAAPVAHAIAGDVAVDMAGASVIQALAVDEGMLNNLAVTEGKIGNLAVTNGKIGLVAVDTPQLALLAVETAVIDDLAVTAGKIAALAVETAKINDLAVTAGKIANGAVGSTKVTATAIIAAGPSAQAPGVMKCYVVDLPTGAQDFVLTPTENFLLVAAAIIKTDGACGANANTVQMLSGANPVTNALNMQTAGPAGASLNDQERAQFLTIDDAFSSWTVASAIHFTTVNPGGNSACRVIVQGVTV